MSKAKQVSPFDPNRPLPTLVRPSVSHKGKGPTILVFGGAPAPEEERRKLAFVGPAGELFRSFLNPRMKGYQLVYDYACPEYLPNEKVPGCIELYRYAEYRANRVEKTKPIAIVTAGKAAMIGLGLMKTSESIQARNGRVFNYKGIPVVCALAPEWFLAEGEGSQGLMNRVYRALNSELQLDNAPLGYEISESCVWMRDGAKLWAMDLETSSLDPRTGRILCAAISNGVRKYLIPLYHSTTWDERTDWVASLFCKWWSMGPRIVHNAKFELRWMNELGAKMPPVIYDTMMTSWLDDENRARDLNDLITQTLKLPSYWHEIDHKRMEQHPIRKIAEYNVKDTHYTFLLHRKLYPRLSRKQRKLSEDVLMPLVKLLIRMEESGMHVDQSKLALLLEAQNRKVARLQRKVEKNYPGLNVRSYVQMSAMAKEKRWPTPKPGKFAKKKKASWDEDALAELAKSRPEVQDIADLRKAQSFQSTVKSWVKHSARDEHIHTSFNLNLTTTGRLSSSGPNMQNLTRGGLHRECLTSRFRGGKIVQADYGQHEFRIMCAQAGQEDVLEAFAKGLDVHQRTADEMTNDHGIPLSRQDAKSCNFGLIYGMTEHGLHKNYGVELEKARRVRKIWFKAYDKVTAFHRMVEKSIEENGYIASIFDWRRHLVDPEDPHQIRQAYNHPIQNAAVVICYMAMLTIDDLLRVGGFRSVLIHQIHDSVVLDCPSNEVNKVSKLVKQVMEQVDYERISGKLKHRIPLTADVKIGEHL